MSRLDDVKAFLKVEHAEEDVVISALIATAESYITTATGYPSDKPEPLYDQAVKLLVAQMYENREGGPEKASPIITAMIKQLEVKSCEAVQGTV